MKYKMNIPVRADTGARGDGVAEIVRDALPTVQAAVRQGAPAESLRSLNLILDLSNNGGRLGVMERETAIQALTAATNGTDEETRDEIMDVVAELDELDVETQPVELAVDHELEDAGSTEWRVRVMRSGQSADGHYFYTEDAVQSAVGFMEGLQCYADHPEPGEVPSVNNLIGWFTSAELVQLDDGVAVDATFHVLQSSQYSKTLRELWDRGAKNTIGFSFNGEADVTVVAAEDGSEIIQVGEFTDMISTDLVSMPNAGGRLLELRASVQASRSGLTTRRRRNQTQRREAPEIDRENDDDGVIDEVRSELEALRAERLENGIEAAIQAANLPDPALRLVEPRVRQAESVQAAREILGEANALWAMSIESNQRSTSRVEVVNRPNRRVLALQGMIARQDIDDVPRYRSIRAAYADISGHNIDAMTPQEYAHSVVRGAWGFNSARLVQASIDSADWPYALGQAIQRETIRQYNLPQYQEWRDLVGPNISNLNDMRTVTRIRTGYFDLLPTVAAGGTYQDLDEPGEEESQYAPSKRGGFASFTWEDALNDDLNELAKIPKKLALAAKVTIWYHVLNVIAAATPQTMDYDSVALFHATHSNLGSSTLSTSAFEAGRKAMLTQTVENASHISLGATPKFLWVPPDLEGAARRLEKSGVDPSSSSVDYENVWAGTFETRVIPFWTDADAWCLTADPAMFPFVEIGFLGGQEEPDIATEAENSGSNFSEDKVTYRVRQVFGVKAIDHRSAYKSVP